MVLKWLENWPETWRLWSETSYKDFLFSFKILITNTSVSLLLSIYFSLPSFSISHILSISHLSIFLTSLSLSLSLTPLSYLLRSLLSPLPPLFSFIALPGLENSIKDWYMSWQSLSRGMMKVTHWKFLHRICRGHPSAVMACFSICPMCIWRICGTQDKENSSLMYQFVTFLVSLHEISAIMKYQHSWNIGNHEISAVNVCSFHWCQMTEWLIF